MRTRLLRSLARGKPVHLLASPSAARTGQSNTATPITEYNTQLFTTVNHLHANFGTGLNKRLPRFIHGADDVGTATASDPVAGKIDNWGLSDPQAFLQFSERFPGDAQYGLGPGEVVGAPNVMDISQPYGMIHGEGSPGGMVYYRSSEEMRGRFLLFSSGMSFPDMGIPRFASTAEAITSVWIAKSNAIPSLTEGLIGLLSGSSLGVLTAYSLGSTGNSNNRDQRFARGEMTTRWVISPGVPIVAIAVDSDYSLKRHAQNRIWAVVLNALGEAFYLTKFPKRPHVDKGVKLNDESIERLAWQTGRTVYWNLVESTRRSARPDPYANAGVGGSYSPRSSWNGMCLSKEQILAETREIEDFATRKPKDFRKTCHGWDMRRKLLVDFAGDDGNNAGENIVVFDCGLEEDTVAGVRRYTRRRFQERPAIGNLSTPPLTSASTDSASPPSLFGGVDHPLTTPDPSFSFEQLDDALANEEITGSITPRPMSEDWRTTKFAFNGLKNVQILATAMDESNLANQTSSEDALLSFSSRSTASSPSLTPPSRAEPVTNPANIPGQRARLFAAGTKTGSILIWDIRAPVSKGAETTMTSEPVRIIYTESPHISSLALSSLYLVHGGNDGLVQAWDVLGSSMQSMKTLHSRHSSRARRQLVQAQASPRGVGINMFAAGAICLDPDATVLRGVVSLGNRLRYWSFSSSAADEYKSRKRRMRRSERGSNNGGERFSGATRTNLKDYIASERFELDREKEQRKKDAQRFAGRFGTDLLGGSEQEMLAYAAMLSQESLEQEKLRRASDTSTTTSAAASTDHSTFVSGNPTPAETPSPRLPTPKSDDELDADIAEAIRQSLAPSSPPTFDILIRQAKPKGRKGSSARPSPRPSPMLAGSSKAGEMSDIDFALQLSLVEEQSRKEYGFVEDFPALSNMGGGANGGKGKGRTG
jgi:WD40 repeat protein